MWIQRESEPGPPAGPTPPARPSSALGQERFPLPHSVTAPPVIQSQPAHASTRRTRMHTHTRTHARTCTRAADLRELPLPALVPATVRYPPGQVDMRI